MKEMMSGTVPAGQVLGIGIDLIEIDRIRQAWQRHGERFLNRIFTDRELDYCLTKKDPAPSLAARWAAKEAVAKALGVGLGESLKRYSSRMVRKQFPGLAKRTGRDQLWTSPYNLGTAGSVSAETISHSICECQGR